MRASFFEYNVAMSGLFTARANLNVVSHNMANSATPGYSRQQTIQQASRPLTLYNGKGMYGTGSEVLGIKQIRDRFLDNKYWEHQNVYGEYYAKNKNLQLIETIFNDLPDMGVLSGFRDYFDSLQDLSTTTPDATYRSNVINAAETLSQMVRTNAEALQKQQRDVNSEVENTVSMINSLGVQITSLNKQIHSYEQDGANANDLRDQRARLVDQLSELVNIEVNERDYSDEDIPYDMRYSILINGSSFINHDNINTLMVVPRDSKEKIYALNGREIPTGEKRNEMDADGLYDIHFANSGAEFDIYSVTLKGTLKGLIDVRDGNNGYNTVTGTSGTPPVTRDLTTTQYKGIPFYLNKLNTLVRTFARAMNEGLDFRLGNIPKATDGNIVGHMYAYNYEGNNNQDLMFTAINGVNSGSTAAEMGGLTMWQCSYTLKDGTKKNEILTSKYNTRPVLPDGAVYDAGSPVQLALWELNYTENGKTIRNIITADIKSVPKSLIPSGAVAVSDPTILSGTTVDYSSLNALNFTVNPKLQEDPYLLACASDPNQGQSANDVILGFGKIGEYNSLFREGKLLDFIIGTSDHLAIDTMQAGNFEENYTEIKMMTDNQRISVSGVDTNEEIMNMIKYNQLFQSCAKLVNVINEIYDTMINRLGTF